MQALALRFEESRWNARFAAFGLSAVSRLLQAIVAIPTFLFLLALLAMLMGHPDAPFHEVNRLAFGLLTVGVLVRAVVLKQKFLVMERASWPMLGLTLVVLVSLIGQTRDRETWSVLAGKYVVPFTVFHLAKLVFSEEKRFRQFEIFSIAVLAYLSFTAIAFLVGARSLVFPRFILDPSLGYHVDRARGPFLQAVANGVSLNILGILVLHAYRRGSSRGAAIFLLLASVPVAILATMTRAVWLSFAGTLAILIFFSKSRMLKHACIALALLSCIGLAAVASVGGTGGALTDRLEEREPVEYRQAVYAGGWRMFLERPLTGWGFHQMPAKLPRYVGEYKDKVLYPHNTYLEVSVELGLVGLAFYLWLMWELWRLGRGAIPTRENHGFLDAEFHRFWPIILGVYWVNAAVVVMSYYFVNGLLFTLAGMLAAQRRRAEEAGLC